MSHPSFRFQILASQVLLALGGWVVSPLANAATVPFSPIPLFTTTNISETSYAPNTQNGKGRGIVFFAVDDNQFMARASYDTEYCSGDGYGHRSDCPPYPPRENYDSDTSNWWSFLGVSKIAINRIVDEIENSDTVRQNGSPYYYLLSPTGSYAKSPTSSYGYGASPPSSPPAYTQPSHMFDNGLTKDELKQKVDRLWGYESNCRSASAFGCLFNPLYKSAVSFLKSKKPNVCGGTVLVTFVGGAGGKNASARHVDGQVESGNQWYDEKNSAQVYNFTEGMRHYDPSGKYFGNKATYWSDYQASGNNVTDWANDAKRQGIKIINVQFPEADGEYGKVANRNVSITKNNNKRAVNADINRLVSEVGSFIKANITPQQSPAAPTGTEAYGSTSPGALGNKNIDLGVAVKISPDITGSTLEFTKYNLGTDGGPNTFGAKSYPDYDWHGIRFNWDHEMVRVDDPYSNDYLNRIASKAKNKDFGISSNPNSNDKVAQIVQWLATGGRWHPDLFRARPSNYFMGDIIDSPILAGGKIVQGLPEYLLTSANDGMTYIFQRDASRNNLATHPYHLVWRYLPIQMDRQTSDGTDTVGTTIGKIADKNYGKDPNQHVWLNNGGLTLRSLKAKGGTDTDQHVFAVGSPGQGGRGVFAFTVGGKDMLTNQAIRWDDDGIFETPKKQANRLGYIIGNPAIGRLSLCASGTVDSIVGGSQKTNTEASVRCGTGAAAAKKIYGGVFYHAIYGNGFNNPNSSEPSALYVRLMFDRDVGTRSTGNSFSAKGSLIRKIEIPGNTSGLASPAVVDMDFDGIVDLAYAATHDGNLYRFDFRGDNPASWKVTKIFSTQSKPSQHFDTTRNTIVKDNRNKKQEVTIAPNVYRYTEGGKVKYRVLFGTGSSLYASDRTDRTIQSIYSIEDNPDTEGNAAEVSLTDLVKRDIKDTGSAVGSTRTVVDKTNQTKRGWYLDLTTDPGERVVSSPIMLKGTVIFSTVNFEVSESTSSGTSPVDQCTIQTSSTKNYRATGWALALNAKTGNAPQSGEINFNTLNKIGDAADKESGGPQDRLSIGVKLAAATNFTLFHVQRGFGQQMSTTDDGNVLSGRDYDLSESPTIPNNTCMSPEEAKTVALFGQTYGSGLRDDFNLTKRICTTIKGVKRLSWREIF